jgi:hypothetical protein
MCCDSHVWYVAVDTGVAVAFLVLDIMGKEETYSSSRDMERVNSLTGYASTRTRRCRRFPRIDSNSRGQRYRGVTFAELCKAGLP